VTRTVDALAAEFKGRGTNEEAAITNVAPGDDPLPTNMPRGMLPGASGRAAG